MKMRSSSATTWPSAFVSSSATTPMRGVLLGYGYQPWRTLLVG
jgi:hypothetical protein